MRSDDVWPEAVIGVQQSRSVIGYREEKHGLSISIAAKGARWK